MLAHPQGPVEKDCTCQCRCAGRVRFALALFLASASLFQAKADDAEPFRLEGRLGLSLDGALDTNPRRLQIQLDPQFDLLTYVLASGIVEARRQRELVSLDISVGGKLYREVRAEDMVAAGMSLRWFRRVTPGISSGAGLSYVDRFQRGDLPEEVASIHYLSCQPPHSMENYRCNRRDYRRASFFVSGDFGHPKLILRIRAGASSFGYKPNRQFFYQGPDAGIGLVSSLSSTQSLRLQVNASRRFYDRESMTFEIQDQSLNSLQDARKENVFSGLIHWNYVGAVIVNAGVLFVASKNNSYGMDVYRARPSISGALPIGTSNTLMVRGSFQYAFFPDGNVFRLLSNLPEEDERHSSIAIQVSRNLSRRFSLIVRTELFSNEFSGDIAPFRRKIVSVGVRANRPTQSASF